MEPSNKGFYFPSAISVEFFIEFEVEEGGDRDETWYEWVSNSDDKVGRMSK